MIKYYDKQKNLVLEYKKNYFLVYKNNIKY